jgi:riboflavin kinase/FMN adenylyltransferase
MIEYNLDGNIEKLNISEEKINLCLGFFDGLHVGHKFLIQQAKSPNAKLAVLTFEGSLKSITQRRKEGLITTVEDRKDFLSQLNVDFLYVIDFTKEIMQMDPVMFIEKFLKPLNINQIFVGEDFRFGQKAKGDVNLLKKYFDVQVVEYILDNGKKISTSTIIKYISDGEIKRANRLLGREYFIKGKVVHGFNAGAAKIGFPTANIELTNNYVMPKKGVYATRIEVNGKIYSSMTNIGIHPTINKLDSPTIETNIFDRYLDIYDASVKLYFVHFVRHEKKFKSVVKLKEQLFKDRENIKQLLD